MKVFDVTYEGWDDKGEIIKTITVLADNEEDARERVIDVCKNDTIYSAIRNGTFELLK